MSFQPEGPIRGTKPALTTSVLLDKSASTPYDIF